MVEQRTGIGEFRGKVAAGRRTWLVSLLVFVFAVAVSVNSLTNGFVWDDITAIQENAAFIIGGGGLHGFFAGWWEGHAASNYYRPLIGLIYFLDNHFFGLAPAGYHAVNVLFHGANSVLVFLVASELGRRARGEDRLFLPAVLVGLLFAAHPIHTESVAWIAGITDVSCAFFFLLSFYLYARSASSERAGRVALLIAASSVFSFLAMLCKEPGVTLLPVLAIFDYTADRRRPWREYAVRYVPYLAGSVLYLALRMRELNGFATGGTSHTGLGPFLYIINVFPLFVKYLAKLVAPVGLSAHYTLHPVMSLLELRGGIPFVGSLLFFIFGIWALKKDRHLFFCLAFMVVTLAPALYFRATGNTPFAERYLYLPSVGFLLAIGVFVGRLRTAHAGIGRGVVPVVAGLICFYAVGSVSRNAVWKDNITLWNDTVQKFPDDADAHNSLGTAYEREGRTAEAFRHYRLAVSLDPGFAKAHVNLGAVFDREGDADRAIEEYREAIRLSPGLAEAHNNLGVALEKKGRLAEAVAEFTAAIALSPGFVAPHVNIGNVYDVQGATGKALEELKLAVSLNPAHAENRFRLGLMYDKMGMIDMAIEQYRTAVSLNPGAADAHNNLGIDLCMQGTPDAAVPEFESAIRVNRDDPEYHYNLARAYEMKGWNGQALEEKRLAMSLERRPQQR